MKACTKPTAHNFNVCLTPQFNPSMPLLENDAGYKIQNVAAALKSPEENIGGAMESKIESKNENVKWILVLHPKDCQVITRK